MRKNLSFFVALLCAVGLSPILRAQDFSAVSPSGHTLYYEITNNWNKTVKVVYPSGGWIISGSVVIPDTVVYDDESYTVTEINGRVFHNQSGMTAVTIPNTVTTIGYWAFAKTGITSVTIPKNVTFIGENAFAADSLTTVYFQAENCNILSSDWYMDNYATAPITTIVFDSTVRYIPSNICKGMQTLTSVTIAEGVTTIGEWAFFRTGITSITIPSTVTYICNNALAAPALATVNFNAKIYSVGGDIFSGSYSYTIDDGYGNTEWRDSTIIAPITTVNFGDSVLIIQSWLFRDVQTLTSVTIPNNVTHIGMAAFANTGLTEITIPASVIEIYGGAFATRSLTTVNYNAKNCTMNNGTPFRYERTLGYNEDDEGIYDTILASITTVNFGDSVRNIPDGMFQDMQTLTTVSFPDSLERIGSNTFRNTALTTVTIPSKVSSIGEYAFAIPTLTTLNYNAGNCNISGNIFSCIESHSGYDDNGNWYRTYDTVAAALATVNFGNSVRSISDGMFQDMQTLTTVSFPDSLESIGSNAFRNTALTTVTIPSKVSSIGEYAFVIPTLTTLNYNAERCNASGNVFARIESHDARDDNGNWYWACDTVAAALATVNFGSNVRKVPDNMFNSLRTLTSVTLPEGIQTIGQYAFAGTGITEITIPATVDTLGESCFRTATLHTVHYNVDSCRYVGETPFVERHTHYTEEDEEVLDSANVTTITIGDNVKRIPNGGIFSYADISSIALPNGLQYIGSDAFYGCGHLSSIVLPTSLTGIGYRAFAYCTSLDTLTIPEGITTLEGYTFSASAIRRIVRRMGQIAG